jgi:asparagine synthase (glutamine-hydrolysing)
VKTTIAVLDKCGENAPKRVGEVLANMFPEGKTRFVLATPSEVIADCTYKEQKMDSSIAVGYASTATYPDDSQIIKLEDATLAFEGRIYSPVPTTSIADFLQAKMKGNHTKGATGFLENVEGDFSVIIAQSHRILALRDPVGVQPLYFGENEQIIALASNRKALWELGIEEPKSFPPGNLGITTCEGFRFKPIKTLTCLEPKEIGMQEAAETLQKLLEYSMKLRVFGQKEVAVAFSGGLDSSLVACLAKQCNVDVNLIHVSMKNQPETEEARNAAEELELPLQIHLFTEADIEKIISKVLELIEEPDPIKASVGIPFFWNAEKAAAAGYRVMLAGQGADELFGGYRRYVNEYILDGDEKVRKTMFHDVEVIHESNIERDEKICNYHDVELRLPFASYQIAEFAMSLPTELKIEKKADSLRKLVLRKTAQIMGLPKDIVEKPKKAVQYSTGINNALKKIAKKQNLTLAEYINTLFMEIKKNSRKS